MVMILLPWQRTKGVSWMNNWHISLHLSISLVTGKPNPKNRQKFYTDGGSYYQIITKKKAICWKGESYTQINKLVIYDRFYTGWGIPHSENQNMTFPIPTFTICYDFVLWIALFFPIWNNFPGSYFGFGTECKSQDEILQLVRERHTNTSHCFWFSWILWNVL